MSRKILQAIHSGQEIGERKWLERLESNKVLLTAYSAGIPALDFEIEKLAAYQATLLAKKQNMPLNVPRFRRKTITPGS